MYTLMMANVFVFCWLGTEISRQVISVMYSISSVDNCRKSRGLLGCDAVQCCSSIPTFRKAMLLPSSGRFMSRSSGL
jgi:hypothetical protein